MHFGTVDQVFDQDVVVVLRYPDERSLRRLRPGSVLVSMLHLDSRPERLEWLEGKRIHGVLKTPKPAVEAAGNLRHKG